MKKIIITQRLDAIGSYKEIRDNLDTNFSNFVENCDYIPIILPNKIKNFKKFIDVIKPDGAILSGGGNPKKKDIRLKAEKKIIQHCLKYKLPLIGICRGAQLLNIFFGGEIVKQNGHVRKKHFIIGKITKNKKKLINSFHEYVIRKNKLSKYFDVLAFSEDGTVECFKHKNRPIMGIMWHPERFERIRRFEKKIFKDFF